MFDQFKRSASETEAFDTLVRGGDVLCETADGPDGKSLSLVLSGAKDVTNLAHFVKFNLNPTGMPVAFWVKGPVNPENDFPGDYEYPRMSGPY